MDKKALGYGGASIDVRECKVDPNSALGRLIEKLKCSTSKGDASYSDSAGYTESYGVSGGYAETGYTDIT